MTLRKLYETAIQLGMGLDFRGEAALNKELASRREEFEALPDWRKPYFDRERLRNPYADCRIVNGPDDAELNTVLLGINIQMPEFLLAGHLRDKGTRIDALVAHHTTGTGVGRSHVYDIMSANIDIFQREGVLRAEAERIYRPLMEQAWQVYDDIPNRMAPDMAKFFDFPMIQIHAPTDLYHGKAIDDVFTEARPETLEDVLCALMTIPEMQSAARIGAEPRIVVGEAGRRAGRILHQELGGWGWPADAYPLLAEAGVDTVLLVGLGPGVQEAIRKAGMGAVRIPHAAVDNLGINLFLDEVECRLGPLNVIPCNYFERITR